MTATDFVTLCEWLGFVRGLRALCLRLDGYEFKLTTMPTVHVD